MPAHQANAFSGNEYVSGISSVGGDVMKRFWPWGVPLIVLLSVAGCFGPEPAAEDDTTIDLRQIARAYEVHISGTKRPPKQMSDLEQIIADLHAAGLNDAPADVLNSSRDGKPYVVIMGVNLDETAGSQDVLAYEQTGSEGKRYVITVSRDVRVLTEEEFKNASFAMGHKPAS